MNNFLLQLIINNVKYNVAELRQNYENSNNGLLYVVFLGIGRNE